MEVDEIELFVQTVLVFLAAFLGIPTGFWLQHWIESRNLQEEKKQLLRLLENNLDDNLRLLNQIETQLTPTYTIYYSLNLSIWPNIVERISILDDWNFIEKIQKAYYELAHLERKIDKQFDLAFLPVPQHVTYPQLQADVAGMRGQLVSNGILPHVKSIRELILELLKDINAKKIELKSKEK